MRQLCEGFFFSVFQSNKLSFTLLCVRFIFPKLFQKWHLRNVLLAKALSVILMPYSTWLAVDVCWSSRSHTVNFLFFLATGGWPNLQIDTYPRVTSGHFALFSCSCQISPHMAPNNTCKVGFVCFHLLISTKQGTHRSEGYGSIITAAGVWS